MPATGSVGFAQDYIKIRVRSTGRVRPPNLSDPQLKKIGEAMVAEQKARWAKAINADGQAAKKLSVRYAIIKQMVLHKRPQRDMSMTGRTVQNFQLRRAAEGKIRAENSQALERQKATRAQGYEEMIGFAISDSKVVMDGAVAEYGEYAKTAWIPLGGANVTYKP